ncbi:hypothetical protein NDU88_005308 [Pleurodeles waltl]|uniref:Uncharacterized protein n=1 Tax=Pleurodeles waltl TaxID=8319 RepID=A0AAV7WUC7_PLEWA|nr:hypothetical protein NDU88_005308 [Pleurodeles waltl]
MGALSPGRAAVSQEGLRLSWIPQAQSSSGGHRRRIDSVVLTWWFDMGRGSALFPNGQRRTLSGHQDALWLLRPLGCLSAFPQSFRRFSKPWPITHYSLGH